MRVTDSLLYRQFLDSINSGNEAVNRALERFGDGKKIRYASDEPTAARVALQLRGRLVRNEGYRQSADAARFDLGQIEATLGESVNIVTRARSLAMGAGAFEDGNDAIASEIEDLRDQLISLANTSQRGRYLYGGTATTAPPFDSNGTYLGNSTQVKAALDSEQSVTVTLDGSEVFQGSGDLFGTLTDLANAVRSGDRTAFDTASIGVDNQLQQLIRSRSQVGVYMRRIDDKQIQLEDESLRLQARIDGIENADLAETVVEFTQATSKIEAVSQASARVLGRSLFDFLG